MTYFVSSDKPATTAKMYQASVVPRIVGWRPDDAQDEGDAAAGQHRARRPHERPGLAEGQGDLDDRAGQDRREDLRHAHLEVQPDLPEDVDRDDDRGDMQARIADVRQDQRVGAAAERERSTRHCLTITSAASVVVAGC